MESIWCWDKPQKRNEFIDWCVNIYMND
jgi:hypothetical protein